MGLITVTLVIYGVIIWLLWKMITEMFGGPRD